GVAGREEVGVQLVPLARGSADLLKPVVKRRLDLVDRALELAGGGPLALEPRDLLVDEAPDPVERRLRRRARLRRLRGDDDLELRLERGRRLKHAHVLRDLQLVDQAPVEPRVLAAGQDLRDDVELAVAWREVRRRQPGQVEARELDAVLDRLALDARQSRLR